MWGGRVTFSFQFFQPFVFAESRSLNGSYNELNGKFPFRPVKKESTSSASICNAVSEFLER